ncbi:LysR family transcriptional regulator [Aerococcus urinaehominis]|uniref:LysR family transcriptional regulator n=1 Tax=Aerococcus urinaehominis TaxID=128944 RepID=A0A0X8FLF5_9LACT|nr:LysR family transcriptional regulator [Aerococcus urinaehominis]AMB99481.1 LysR family transcriptional regulator [Aerococcus urinaehominis]SDM26941.1 DNA-binding transcriptional regulator, LysR family [Aerococcus urinaehominis]
MRIEDLAYFRKMAEVGSITQAAQALFISQPSLSNAMQKLEEELGLTLFIRSQKGISLTETGEEFLQYANQVLEQFDLLQRRYSGQAHRQQIFKVATHHYAFVVDAFARLLKRYEDTDYQASLWELRTWEVLDEVINLKSEIGVIYRSNYNQRIIDKALKDNNLSFHSLIKTRPHVFIYRDHPLANQAQVTFEDLAAYPRLNFEQGQHNSFYYWEEVHAEYDSPKTITVSDRATIFNLMIGLNGYTISSGIINEDLNGPNIIAVPLVSDEVIEIGYITNNFHQLNPIAEEFIDILIACVNGDVN